MTARSDGIAGLLGVCPGGHGRRTRSLVQAACQVALLGAAFTTQPGFATELSPAETRGQRIYTQGESASSRLITAQVRFGAPPVPASTVPCAQCHGTHGRGAAEDGAAGSVPDINWSVLTDPAGHVHAKRRHAALDAASFATVITRGIDPDGNRLDVAMPRYEMDEADVLDLIAYLKSIDQVPDPGLDDTRLSIGTVLPLAGALARDGQDIRRVIEQYFAAVNAAGGIHGRRLELVVAGYGENDDPAIWQAQNLVASESVFALIGTYLPGFGSEMSRLAEDREIPVIGPYTVMPSPGTDGGYTFYVMSGLPQQAESLVDAVELSGAAPGRRVAVVSTRVQGFDRIAARVIERAGVKGLDVVSDLRYALGEFNAVGFAGELRSAGADAVIFLGPARDFLRLSLAADKAGWYPHLLAPGPLVDAGLADVPPGFSGRLTLAYGWMPGDQKLSELRDTFHARLPRELDYINMSAAETAAFTATTVLLEGLQRAGRELSREQLVRALDGLEAFHPGLTPAVSFSANRRLGSNGAWSLTIDLDESPTAASADWIELN